MKFRSRRELAWINAVSERLEPSKFAVDPVGWSRSRVDTHLWSKQREIMRSVTDNRLTCVQSAHATGKSFTASLTSAWWVDTHPPGEAIVVSTAPSREQVHSILWEEIRKLHRNHNLLGEVQRSDRWLLSDGTLIGMGRKPPDHQQSAFQGIHRKYVLVVMDEAGGIPAWLWDAVKTITTGPECRVLAIGNPDDNSSEFARVCQQDPTWNKIKISAYDSPNFTDEDVPLHVKEHLVSKEWVSDVKRSWGEDSPLFKAKVLGEFADSEHGLIPLTWVLAANRRWIEWNEKPWRLDGRTVLGVDVGHFGGDRTVVATRKGDVVTQIDAWAKKDTVEVANIVEARCRDWTKPVSVVDGIGVGAGVVDTLRVRGLNVIPFIASKSTRLRDATGEQMFSNVRAAAWWHLRELLDPAMDARLALPPSDELTADLITPRYEPVTGGRIKIESKDEIRKRLGRSTDYGDAVVQCMWAENYEREYAQIPAMALQPLEWLESSTDWDDDFHEAP